MYLHVHVCTLESSSTGILHICMYINYPLQKTKLRSGNRANCQEVYSMCQLKRLALHIMLIMSRYVCIITVTLRYYFNCSFGLFLYIRVRKRLIFVVTMWYKEKRSACVTFHTSIYHLRNLHNALQS